MFAFFDSVVTFFGSIFTFLKMIVEGLGNFLLLLIEVPSFLVMSLGVLPSICIGFATAIIAITITKVILGR